MHMRLSTFTLLLSTLAIFSCFPTPASSIHPHALSRQRETSRSPVPQVLSSRQHRISRDLLDVCIDANVDLLANATQLLGLQSLLGPLDLDGNIQLCLCLKDLDIYLETNNDIQALVGLLGSNTVRSIITALINTSPEAQHCAFPQHAHHTCNTADSCHYECDHPYIRKGGVCVCPAPHISCNGVCGYFPQGCGSAVPQQWQKRTNPALTIAQAKASCRPHETVCGIPGSENPRAFECVDINTTKDSCGGCVTPHPFFERDPIHSPLGHDCSTISKSKTVSCSAQRCIVHACIDGWVPNPEATGCIAHSQSSKMLKVRKLLAFGDGTSTALGTSEKNVSTSPLANVTASVNTNLRSQVDILLTLIGKLHSTPVFSSNSSFDPSFFSNVDKAVANVTRSSTLSSLHSSLEVLYTSECVLRDALIACGCISDLALESILADLWLAVEATLGLLASCDGDSNSLPSSTTTAVYHHTISSPAIHAGTPTAGQPTSTFLSISIGVVLSIPTSVTETATHTSLFSTSWSTHATSYSHSSKPTPPPKPSSHLDIPIVVGLNTILSSFGLGNVKGLATVDGVLGDDGDNTVNNILDGLDIGPHEVRRNIPAPEVSDNVPLIVGLNHLLANVGLGDVKAVAVVDGLLGEGLDEGLDNSLDGLGVGPNGVRRGMTGSGVPEDIPLVVSVNRLLGNLGVANVKTVAVVDGLLGDSQDTVLDNALDSLNIGPHDVKRGASLQDWHSHLPATSNTTDDLRFSLDALIDNLLQLHEIRNSLLPLTSVSGLPAVTNLPTCSSSNLIQCLTDNLITATILVLYSPTSPELLHNIDQLYSASLASVNALDGCSCVENEGLEKVYGYFVHVVHSAAILADLCHSQGEPTCLPNSSIPGISGSGSNADHPLIIGLRKLLNGLGLNAGHTDVVVGNILDNGLDDSLNSVLDSLNIGPNGQRR